MTYSIQNMLKNTFKVFVFFLVISTYTSAAFAAVTLKSQAIVTEDHITVGDVFDGLTHNADYVLAPAPKPGKDLIWNARTLNRIAEAFDLSWAPESNMTQLKIKRMAVMVSQDSVKTAIKDALVAQGLQPETYDIEFAQGVKENGIAIPHNIPANIAVDNIQFNPVSKSFSAIIRAPAQGPAAKTIPVAGYTFDIVEVPVLRNRLKRDDIITASDVKMIPLRADTLPDDVIIDKNDVIGTTPRSSINAASPIREFDLRMPKIVKRGDQVTMVYNNGRIYLETVGKAMQDGAKGDFIRVMNVSSHTTLQAEVIGMKRIKVN